MPSAADLARAKLAASGLSPKDAVLLKMRVLSASEVVKLDPSFHPYPALKIPYFDLAGKMNGFYRLRYLGEMRGFDALRAKPLRYVQPPNTPPGVYLPPFVEWKNLSPDPGRALYITEGELKAASACRLAIPTIGLGGVWSWKSTKRGLGFLPQLGEFTWKERQVYLVFDSDFSVNPDVMKALVALASELTARGARPSILSLPDLPELAAKSAKTGLDDFLLLRGEKTFNELVSAAAPFNESEELWKLNSEVVYVRNPGLVVILKDGRKLSVWSFREHALANRHYYQVSYNAKGEQKLAKKPIAPAWVAWEQRAELEKITYQPGAGRIHDGCYNYWPGWGCEPRRGDVSLWKRLLDHLFQGDVPARRWFEQWLAYPLQHPGAKLYAASVMWGATQGTGKSLIGYSVGRIYGENFKEISDKELSGSFNEWAENRQFVMADDVTSAEYKKSLMDELKFMITRQKVTINAKYIPSYTLPDLVNWYFTANAPDAFIVEDTDRRYFVWEAPAEPLPERFYVEYDKALHDPAMKFSSALFHHLLSIDLSGFNPKGHALSTKAKSAMQLDSKTDLGAWIAQLKEYPAQVLRMGEMELGSDLWTSAQLLSLYDQAGSKRASFVWMGRELKRAGFHQVNEGLPVMTAKGPQRLYALRNSARWMKASPSRCASHYNKFFAKGKK